MKTTQNKQINKKNKNNKIKTLKKKTLHTFQNRLKHYRKHIKSQMKLNTLNTSKLTRLFTESNGRLCSGRSTSGLRDEEPQGRLEERREGAALMMFCVKTVLFFIIYLEIRMIS